MKSFLIKAGKAGKIFRREGIAGGGKRFLATGWQYLKMLRQPKGGDVLFIDGGALGDSALYRSHHQAEELEKHGFRCGIVAQDNAWLLSSVNKYGIFIIRRVLYNSKIKKFIEEIKKRSKEIIFDTDDLVFDPKYLKSMDSYQKMNRLEKMLYENGVGGEILRDPYVKTCVTTTSYLAKILEGYDKKVFIVPNKLSNRDLEIAENIIKHKTYNIKQKTECSMLHVPCSMIKIGYFSGTLSHNKDFATITDALMRVMEKYPQAELFLAGPLDVENSLNKFKGRINQIPRVSREKYFGNIAQVDINLAPLEMGNPFCEAKSELKFFEAGIVGVPTVAVRNQTFSEAIVDGVSGFLADNTAEWVEKLSRLIEDENLRKSMGEKAREKALADYAVKNSHNEEYYNYLKEHTA